MRGLAAAGVGEIDDLVPVREGDRAAGHGFELGGREPQRSPVAAAGDPLGAARRQKQAGLLVHGRAAEAEPFHHLGRRQVLVPLGHRATSPLDSTQAQSALGLTDYTGVVQPAMVELSDPLFR